MNTQRKQEQWPSVKVNKRKVGAAIALVLLLPMAAWAGGVVTNCTEAALRAAMTGGGTVTFACDGTITLASTITNANDTTLDGSGHQVIISGNSAVRVFCGNSNVNFTLINLTVEEGYCDTAGAGILNDGGTVNLLGVTFIGNQVVSGSHPEGGAIYNSGTIKASACTFFNNGAVGVPSDGASAASGAGGAVCSLGVAIIVGSTFSNNIASGAGVPYGIWGQSGGSGNGGAICNYGLLQVRASAFLSNNVQGGNGGNGMSAHILSSAPGYSGGLGGDGFGGAVDNEGTASIANSIFAGNRAIGGGGGAGGNGGYETPPGSPTGPSGGGGGGGGWARGAVFSRASIEFVNCTMAQNSAQGGPGGPGGPGGGKNGPPGPAGASGMATGGFMGGGQLLNTIIAGNSPTNFSGGLTDAGHNLSSDASCGFTSSSSMNNTNPRLGPLTNNGGPTLTMALLPGSPAIDAGNTSLAPTTDQRGFSRPIGRAADIGAFEYGSVMSPIAVSRSGATSLSIVATGIAGRSCRLLSSTDLSSWAPFATNQVGSDGTILFYVNSPPGSGRRFYRLVMP